MSYVRGSGSRFPSPDRELSDKEATAARNISKYLVKLGMDPNRAAMEAVRLCRMTATPKKERVRDE